MLFCSHLSMDPPPIQPQISATHSSAARHETPIAAVEIRNCKKAKTKKKKLFKGGDSISSSSSSHASASTSGFAVKGPTRVLCKRRGPKVVFNAARRSPSSDDIGHLFGMSIGLFVSQILESIAEIGGGMSSDHLAKLCSSALRESLANDFGNTFECFIDKFEQSFGSTLRTQKSIKELSEGNTRYISSKQIMGEYSQHVTHEEQDDFLRSEACRSSSSAEDSHSNEVHHSTALEVQFHNRDQVLHHTLTNPINLGISLHGQTDQLACYAAKPVESVTKQFMFNMERANELKEMELCLKLEELELNKEQVALGYDANLLERSKLFMGRSKASFKAEKFKTQLEDTRHSELLRKCIDCLVAGIFVMAAALFYGTYVYSYKRIREAVASCTPGKDSNSWWNPMSSFNTGYKVLRCQAEVVSRMLFGFFMIIAIAYLILQRTAGSKQTMPVTFIVLMLGIACGWAGKFCVDTLGGSGYHWLIFWETLCLVHFFCNVFTSVLFYILHGPVDVSPGIKGNSVFPYWIRRLVFYGIMFLFLPLLCGLMPFASFGEWTQHFVLLVTDVDYYWVGKPVSTEL